MRVRPFVLFSCLLTCLGLLAQPASAASLTQQRLLYDEAKRALDKNDPAPYLRNRAALRDYPLEPLLAYDELTLRLKTASDAEIEAFLTEHDDLPQIGWMKLRWLRWAAERGDWQTFIKHYSPALEFTELDCLLGEYQFLNGKTADGAVTAQRLWLVGKSQPNTCDRLFDLWRDHGGLTEEMRWKRLKLAAEARNYGLAGSLVKTLGGLAPQGQLLLDVAQKPELLEQRARFATVDHHTADAAGLGLRRLAKEEPEQALGLLEEYSRRLPFTNDEKVAIAREIGLSLARHFDPRALQVMTQYDPELRDDTVSEWRARLLLRLGRWGDVSQLTRQMPGDLAATNRWRYWQARSLQLADPNSKDSVRLYLPVAGQRDFYGFLAADRINAPYQIVHKPMALDPRVVQRVRNNAGIRRAMEFQARGQANEARREWYHASRLFSREELVAQARLGYEMGWYFPAIRAISQAQYWDDLDVRFPMAHQTTMTREARSRGLHSSWVFAITRQESGFSPDARSGVGAMGLMQLMPTTAKETARRYGIPLASPQQAFDPDVNIQLGAAYLSQIYGQFGGNRILASAAYNAGPTRVRQWLSGNQSMPFDIWIETIPFDETRQYVQNVLSYSVIYGEKLGAPQKLVEFHERELSPQ